MNPDKINLCGDGELVFGSYEDAISVANELLKNDYVTMLSREEELYIVNYLYAHNAGRNAAVFFAREDWDMLNFVYPDEN